MFKKKILENQGSTKLFAHLLPIGLLVLLFAIAPPAAADPYLGGIDLATVNGTYGTVTGDLWFDAYSGFDYAYSTPVMKNSTLPCDPDDVAWARLYVDVYIGHMEYNRSLKVTTKFDGDGAGGSDYVTLGSEIMNTTYTFPYNGGNWDGQGPIWINDHCNRVTSDFLIWYDVSDNITSSSVSTLVNVSKPDGTTPFDGRVKMITLVVAYNNQSCKVIHYWVNQGHDTDSYLTDDADYPYTGNTTFNTSAVYTPGEANLTVLPLSSFNGNYTFNSNGDRMTWANPHQGSYFQWQSWDVTSLISDGIDSYMTYGRNEEDDRPLYSGYFKIPLTLLTVEERHYVYDFSDTNPFGKAGTTLLAYGGNVNTNPPTANDIPTNTITSYSSIASNNDVYETTTTVNGFAAQRFELTLNQSASNVENLTATWVGRGNGSSSNGESLYIWNDGNYEELQSTTDNSKVTLSGSKTGDLSDYISNNKVILLVVQKSSTSSTVETDYVKLEVLNAP